MSATRLLAASLLALLALGSCTPSNEPFAKAFVIEDLDQTIGGPKALAQPGDFRLENEFMRVAIVAPRASMGPGLYGGSIIDVDLQWNDPAFEGGQGRDQFAELFPTASMNVIAPDPENPDSVQIIADGSDGGPATVRVISQAEPFLNMLGALWALVSQPDMWLITDYIATPGEPWITIETTVYFGWDGEGEPPRSVRAGFPEDGQLPVVEWAIQSGMVLGDFYLSGGSVDVFGSEMGFDEDGAIFEARLEGKNTFLDPLRFPFLAGTADGISYGIAAADNGIVIPLFTAGQTVVVGAGRDGDGTFRRFEPGSAFSYRRYLFAGTGDIGSIVDRYVEARDIPHGFVRGNVLEEGTQLPLSGASIFVYHPDSDRPWSQWESDVDPRDERLDGSFGGALPVGPWDLVVHKVGRPDSERIPVTVLEGQTVGVQLASPRPGLLSFTVRDEKGRTVPAKITLFTVGEDSHADPVLGDGFIAGNPEAVLWPMHGEGEVELPDGVYYAVASRGLEYELDVSEPFEITATQRHHLDLQVVRSVQTDGWVSADLHVHASPSHDSGVALADRARTMACEGVEFFASTDHDYMSDYAPVIEALGLEEWVQSAVGNETTTLEIGHFLAFPMAADFTGDAGGAFDWTGHVPEDIIAELRRQGRDAGFPRPLITVAHPRAGILGYFDQYGFDPYSGTPGNPAIDSPLLAATNPLQHPDNLTWEFDALEVMGTKDLYLFRTPTQPELDRYDPEDPSSLAMYDILERTLDEQDDLEQGVYRLGYGHEGQIDDWFTLLNLGFRYTALGNSDTHGWTSTEAGCPRNFVVSETDEPAYIDDQDLADAVHAHRVVASYGPFVQMWVDGEPIGSDVTMSGETVEITVEVQAPTWIDVDRVEIYENGTLIEVVPVEIEGVPHRLLHTLERTPAVDAWYVAIAMGDGDLAPLFTPVEIPYIPLDQIVTEALAGVEAVGTLLSASVPIPLAYPVHPYALTNPIWVDVDGDGWDAPGLPQWLEAPVEPE